MVVWGCGPVGLFAAYASLLRGAARVISIDNVPERLAKAALIGSEPLNFDEFNVTEEIAKRIQGGPSVCIDCVGFRFPKGVLSWLQYKSGLETDSGDIIREMVLAGKKGARLALIGDYFNFTNGFPSQHHTVALNIRELGVSTCAASHSFVSNACRLVCV